MGTSCRLSETRRAVTTISSMENCACAVAAVSPARMPASTGLRLIALLMCQSSSAFSVMGGALDGWNTDYLLSSLIDSLRTRSLQTSTQGRNALFYET